MAAGTSGFGLEFDVAAQAGLIIAQAVHGPLQVDPVALVRPLDGVAVRAGLQRGMMAHGAVLVGFLVAGMVKGHRRHVDALLPGRALFTGAY